MEHDNRTATLANSCHTEDYQNENKKVVKIARHNKRALKRKWNACKRYAKQDLV